MNRLFQITLILAVLIFAMSPIFGQRFSAWSDPVNMESFIPGTSTEFNTAYGDGCPIQAPDGLSFYIASNRPGGLGGQDIWVSTRATTSSPWGAFVNVGAPINSTADDFCPSPAPNGSFYFVSARAETGACGGADIYHTTKHGSTWDAPENLGCEINSPGTEWSPSYFQDEEGHGVLYFASNRPDGHTPGGTDLDTQQHLRRLGSAGPSAGTDQQCGRRHSCITLLGRQANGRRLGTSGKRDRFERKSVGRRLGDDARKARRQIGCQRRFRRRRHLGRQRVPAFGRHMARHRERHRPIHDAAFRNEQ